MLQPMDEFILAIHEQKVEKVIRMLEDPKIDLTYRYKPKALSTDREFLKITPVML
jgi:hypothetical protein